MSDEQTPPKRDVNELFTLDASEPTSDHDGPLAHLLSMSPVSDLDGPSSGDSARRRSGGDGDLPGIADVSGLEDLYVTTTELPPGAPQTEPSSPAFTPNWAGPEAAEPQPPAAQFNSEPIESVETESVSVDPRPTEPVPVQADRTADSDPFRYLEVGGNLRFSTEARAGQVYSYPAPLVPNAVPAPVAPNKSVRVPGQERRRGALPMALIEISERRWFWSSAAGFFGLVLMVLLVAGDLVPNPLADDRTDVVADNRVPAAPVVDEATETPEADTSSSTGAGTGQFAPADATTSMESTTSSTAPASTRGVVTTARPAVRSTTTVRPTSTTPPTTTTSSSTTTTVATSTTADSSSTTDTSSSTTTDTSGSTTTDTTDGSSSTTEDQTTTTESSTSSSSSSSSSSGSSGSSSEPADP